MDTPDAYGGAAVTSLNIVRKDGLSTWTQVAGAVTFAASPNEVYTVVFGEGDDDDQDQPFGCKTTYMIPCGETPTLSAVDYCTVSGVSGIIDDSVEAALR